MEKDKHLKNLDIVLYVLYQSHRDKKQRDSPQPSHNNQLSKIAFDEILKDNTVVAIAMKIVLYFPNYPLVQDVELILDYLTTDDYISETTGEKVAGKKKYRIKQKGILFWNDGKGGYENQAKKERLSKIKKTVTWVVSIITAIATLLFFLKDHILQMLPKQ